MRAHQARFVTACQQLLALAVVLAALTPAASVVSLDVVGTHPTSPVSGTGADDPHGLGVQLAAYVKQASKPSLVDTAPVEPEVRTVALTAPVGRAAAGFDGRLAARETRAPARSGSRVVSTPQRVVGYGAVGLTWSRSVQLEDGQLSAQARTRSGGTWSGWTAIDFDAEHAPDPGTREARHAVPGTDVLLVGRVDDVQVRVTTARGIAAPAGLSLAVIDPGANRATATERPALDPATGTTAATGKASADRTPITGAGRAAYTPMPGVYSRAQWGADEKMRSASSPRYYEVHAGFVHHTATANNYSEADVPGIIRSIYAYHTKSRGWSDIGYNFLVDRFGRIWEGRYGGIDRPVVGAHTLNYNEYSFAMSAIGNYETTQPSQAMLSAYGALFAWKLSLHGVDASSTQQWVGSRNFQAINGHRDAASTACPGKYLYAQIPAIRQLAAGIQVGWSGRERETNLLGSPNPDLIVRGAADKQAYLVQTTGSTTPVVAPVATGIDLSGANTILNVGDWDRDGLGDFMTRQSDGTLLLYRGDGQGHFAAPITLAPGFNTVKLLTAVGDVTGDGWPDLMAQPKGAAMRIYPGLGLAGFGTSFVAYSTLRTKRMVGIGRMDADGAPDTVFLTKGKKNKRLKWIAGNGPGGLTGKGKVVRKGMKKFDWIVGVSDLDLTGHADLVLRKKRTGELFALSGDATRFRKPVLIGTGFSGFDLVG